MFNYGVKIKKILDKKNISQTEIAKKLGLSVAYVNQLILGRRKPRRETLIKIADTLDVPLEDLLPGRAKGKVPILLRIGIGAYSEYPPDEWYTKWLPDQILDYIPLPPGYTARRAKKEKLFAIQIEGKRFSPIFFKGMKIYLKSYMINPTEVLDRNLFLFREENGMCSFKEIVTKKDFFVVKDLLTRDSVVYQGKDIPKHTYKVIALFI